MKGDLKVIDSLNFLLSEELAAINQYMVHAEIAENWGYEKLGKRTQKLAVEEMKHAEKIAERLWYLGGTPTTKPSAIEVGKSLKEFLELDTKAEVEAIEMYRQIIEMATKGKDVTTAFIFKEILEDEEEHHDLFTTMLEEV